MGYPPGFGSCEPGDLFCAPPPIEPPSGWGTAINIGGLAIFGTIINGIIQQVFKLVAGLMKLILQAFRSLGKFLLHTWQNYVKKAITWLASHVQKLRAWLKRTIGPIIKRLEKINKWYDTHILKQQLRMLQMLQSIRRFLGILRIFHVKWAKTLDNALADVQNRIEQAISIVRGNINGIINWLNAITNPIWIAGLLHKGGFFIRSLDSLLRAAHLGGMSNWGPQSDQTGYGSQATGNMTGITEAMHQDTATQTGSFSEFGKSGKATWDYLETGWR